jgi:hypothetical protein
VRILRTAIEIVGAVLALAVHGLAAVLYALGSTLLRDGGHGSYWIAVALGYVSMALVAIGRRYTLAGIPWRSALDAWLLACPVAAVLVMILVNGQWPLSFPRWDGHGMGAGGGEANSLFLPWIHLAGWWLAATGWHRWRRGHA